MTENGTREIPAASWTAPASTSGASAVGQMDPDVTMPLAVPGMTQPAPQQHPAQDPRTPLADWVTAGWSQVFTVRCQYPAAVVETPIPCGAVFRDEGAMTFPALKHAAVAAGWRPDDLGRWACAECVQLNPAYRSPRHVTLWTGRAAEARQATGNGWTAWVTAQDELIQVSAEFPVVAALEWRLREAVLAAAIRPRHLKAVTA